jgi:hypothetical protein
MFLICWHTPEITGPFVVPWASAWWTSGRILCMCLLWSHLCGPVWHDLTL